MPIFAACIDTAGVAIVTGGASGFGLEVCRRCAAAGQRVALLDLSAAELEQAAAEVAAEADIR